ncbi:MAG: hypothetical protein ACK4ZJ_18080, partial [Allorhizobium sp.]
DNTLRCGHRAPDEVMTMVDSGVSFQNPGFDVERTVRISLSDPDRASSEEFGDGSPLAGVTALCFAACRRRSISLRCRQVDHGV